MTIEPTDAELLRATAAGDADAFAQFVVRHRSAVFRYVRTRSRDADAEDALQQTFVQAWRNAGQLTVEGSARAWLLTVARNALSRMQRREQRVGDGVVAIDELGEQAGFACKDVTPERIAAAAEERAVLQEALAALPDVDREILVLRDLERLPGEQVAELLSLTLSAMKSRLHRARLHLVAELRRRLPEEAVQ